MSIQGTSRHPRDPMNPSAHHPISIEVTPCVYSPKRETPDQFNLRIRYRPDGDFQMFAAVHVPHELQPALLSGDIRSLHLDTLEVNGLASRLLPGAPSYLILGVRRRNGEEVTKVPAVLKAALVKRRICGAAACLLGCGLLTQELAPWGAALALVVGTHMLRTARKIPVRPFLVYTGYRG